MATDSPAQARLSFADQLALFDLGSVTAQELVAAATDLLVQGVDPEPVVALASQVVTPFSNPFEIGDLVHRAREAMGMPRLDPEQTAIRATQGQLRLWQQRLLTDADLLVWAHRQVGHEGPAELQQLVITYDVLGQLEYDEAPLDGIHSALHLIANRLLLLPDPWQAPESPPEPS